MPAVSEAQQKKMGIALSMKRGKTPKSYSPKTAKMAESMSEEKLEEMASFPNPDAVTDIRLGMVLDPDMDSEPIWEHFPNLITERWWF